MDESLQEDLWKTIKNARDDAVYDMRRAELRLAALNALLARMKGAGMNSYIPTLEELQEAMRT